MVTLSDESEQRLKGGVHVASPIMTVCLICLYRFVTISSLPCRAECGAVSYGFDFVIDHALSPAQPMPVPIGALPMRSSLAAGTSFKRREHA